MKSTHQVGGEAKPVWQKIKRGLGFLVRTALLGLALFLTMMVVSSITAAEVAAEVSADQINAMMASMLIVNFVDALILGLIIHCSSWRGWRLVIGLVVALFGVQTIMGQIEALVFLTPLGERWGAGSVPMLVMPFSLIISNFITGAAKAVVAVPVGATLFGKLRQGEPRSVNLLPRMGWWQWGIKLMTAVVLYELLYFGFGYYVAWKSPALLEFYQGTDPGSFLAQMKHVVASTPTLIPFQGLRALLWVAFALPVVQMLKEERWFGGLLAGLLLGLLAFSHTLVPNPYMPDAVRIVHFIETLFSTFIYGVVLFWLFHRRHESASDLFGINDGSLKRDQAPAISA